MITKHAKTAAAITMAGLLLGGCGNNTYKTSATDTQLSAYAGQATYPYQLHADMAVHVFSEVADDGTITLYNAGDEPYSNFELWINRIYTLHVDKLDARSKLPFDPATLFNKTGASLKGAPANTITSIQILSADKLWDVQGPIAH